MKRCQLFIVLIVFIFLSGCGNEVSTSTKDSSATITMAYLYGTWSEKCQYDSSDGSSYKTGAVFSDSADNATISSSYYSGSICNNDYVIVRQKINTIRRKGFKSILKILIKSMIIHYNFFIMIINM